MSDDANPEIAERGDAKRGAQIPAWVLLTMGFLGAAVLALGAVVVLGNGDDDTASSTVAASDTEASGAETEEETFTATGSITMIDYDMDRYQGQCFGSGGYSDMEAGTQVVVRDASGTSLAFGELGTGSVASPSECDFNFVVKDIPSGDKLYTIEVGSRGEINFTEDEAIGLSFTLG